MARAPRVVLRIEGSEFALSLPIRPAPLSGTESDAACAEWRGAMPRKSLIRSLDALGDLTGDELDALAEFACLEAAETVARRSWRRRMLRACGELAELDSTLYRPLVVQTGFLREGCERHSDDPELRPPKPPPSPFIRVPPASQT